MIITQGYGSAPAQPVTQGYGLGVVPPPITHPDPAQFLADVYVPMQSISGLVSKGSLAGSSSQGAVAGRAGIASFAGSVGSQSIRGKP